MLDEIDDSRKETSFSSIVNINKKSIVNIDKKKKKLFCPILAGIKDQTVHLASSFEIQLGFTIASHDSSWEIYFGGGTRRHGAGW